ncbi:ATP-binding protein [Streptosporangium sp. NPDC000563]|uniref:sensor histidine kinase n=1 Tax=Streptosporangium sp. NPDC000563 TaxID=3154366 RepID=UPI003317F1F7
MASRLSVRLRATLAATAIVAVALGVASAVLVGVLTGSLTRSASDEATRRAAATADVLAGGTVMLDVPAIDVTRAAVPATAEAPSATVVTVTGTAAGVLRHSEATLLDPDIKIFTHPVWPAPAVAGPSSERKGTTSPPEVAIRGTADEPSPHAAAAKGTSDAASPPEAAVKGTASPSEAAAKGIPSPSEVAAKGTASPSEAAAKGTANKVSSPAVALRSVAGAPAFQLAEPAPWASGDSFALATMPVDTANGTLFVQARASMEPTMDALRSLRGLLLPGIPALLLLVAVLTWLTVGRALAPVSAIRAEVADITANDLHRRVPVPRSRDEIARLAETMNSTLDRLELAVGRHKRFVADAAHELRSPLAILRTRLELAQPEPLAAEALTDVERIQALTSDLLLLARLDAGEPACHEEVDLGQVTAEEAARSRPRPEVKVTLEVAADTVVMGSAGQLRRLVANLVDNAVRHAGSTVTVRLAVDGGEAVLDVRDDGPGIPAEHHEAVFDRFTRLDEARDRDAGGAGLGLAIARDIAVRHGGSLRVAGKDREAWLQARFPVI